MREGKKKNRQRRAVKILPPDVLLFQPNNEQSKVKVHQSKAVFLMFGIRGADKWSAVHVCFHLQVIQKFQLVTVILI